MAKGINKAIIVGSLGQDPEVKYSQSGSAITNISVATNDSWKDKNTGQKVEKTEWHRIVFFNKLAEIAGEYLRKGSQVYIEGKLTTRKWQDQQGQDRYTTEIVANEMQMIGAKPEGQSPQQGYQNHPQQDPQRVMHGSTQGQAPQQRPNQAAPSQYAQVPHAQQPAPQGIPMDDDVPW